LVDLSSLVPGDALLITYIGAFDSTQCAFNADYTTLWTSDGGDWSTVDLSTGALSATLWTSSGSTDLGGASVSGVPAGGGGDCASQYASIKTRVPKSVKRNGLLRYRAHLKNGNKTVHSIDELRLEVALPPEVSIVSSSSNLKHRGVVGTADATSMVWTNFNLTKRKVARFDLKMRVSGAVTKGQMLTLDTTLYHERGGSTSCLVSSSLQVRIGSAHVDVRLQKCVERYSFPPPPISPPPPLSRNAQVRIR
jgi:hypothetical protein